MSDSLESRLAQLFQRGAAKLAGAGPQCRVANGRYAFTVDGVRACALEIEDAGAASSVVFPYDGRWDDAPFRGEVQVSRSTLSAVLDGPLRPHVAFLRKLVRVEGDLPSVLALLQMVKSG